jgi:ubiquinone/menaquinone biosynthesis C-methylase UbiE
MATHRDLIPDQFSRQALPFSASAMINDKDALKMIVDAARPGPKDTVLDVACGPGLVVCAFAPYAGRVIGIDMTPAMFDRARRFAAEQGGATSTGIRATHTYCRMPLRASLLWSLVIHFII